MTDWTDLPPAVPVRVRLNRTGHVLNGTITSLAGREVSGHRRKVFVHADHRPAAVILEALRAGEEVIVEPEPWQIGLRF